MKTLKRVVLVLVVLAVVIQVFRPDRTNPKEDPTLTLSTILKPPANVAAILDRSCGDCHSYRTRWPWYTNVAPVSWFVASHVKDGRRALNFSNWAAYTPERQGRKLNGICKEMKAGEMPLGSYLVIHTDAKVSDADRNAVCSWTETAAQQLTR